MRPTRGSSSTSSATASATLARIGATWNRSIDGIGFGVRARIAASRMRSGVSPASGSGARPAKRSSAPTRRGKLRPASSASAPNSRETSLNVLHSSSRASSRSRSSHRASSSSRSTVAGPGQQAPGLELDERGGDQQELRGHVEVDGLEALDLGQVGVDDAGQADLVDVDLGGQDQLQEQVERALVGPVGQLGRHIDRHDQRNGTDVGRPGRGCNPAAGLDSH